MTTRPWELHVLCAPVEEKRGGSSSIGHKGFISVVSCVSSFRRSHDALAVVSQKQLTTVCTDVTHFLWSDMLKAVWGLMLVSFSVCHCRQKIVMWVKLWRAGGSCIVHCDRLRRLCVSEGEHVNVSSRRVHMNSSEMLHSVFLQRYEGVT